MAQRISNAFSDASHFVTDPFTGKNRKDKGGNKGGEGGGGKQKQQLWNDDVKVEAAKVIQAKIQEKEKLMDDMDRMVEQTLPGVEARVESQNQIGAVIFMKLILKYETQKELAQKAIEQFQALGMEVRYSEKPIDYNDRIKQIETSAVKPGMDQDDKDDILKQCHTRLKEFSRQASMTQLKPSAKAHAA